MYAGLSYDAGPNDCWVLILPALLHVRYQNRASIKIRAIDSIHASASCPLFLIARVPCQ